MKRFSRIAAAVLIAPTLGVIPSQTAARQPDRRVALTFDDLPMSGGECDPETVRDVTRRLTDYLEARSIPAAGFATPGRDCLEPDLVRATLSRWYESGSIVGNHTTTHPDLNSIPLDEYTSKITSAQDVIEDATGGSQRWFRPPYLHTGDDATKKAGLTRFLSENGYRMAPVTVDNQEWVYAAVYADADRRGDTALAARVRQAYLQHLEESFSFYEELSRRTLGREIPQILLLHVNRLNADAIDDVVKMLERRRYHFVDLPAAMDDPAYAREDTYVGPRGLSWIQRWALEDGVQVSPEPREAEWVAAAFEALEARQQDEQDVREALGHYLAGHATGGGEHHDSVFHRSANLYWVADGEFRTRTAADYIQASPGQPAPNEAERERRISWVEVTGNAAVARIDLDYPGVRFTDYMTMLKIEGEWRIVAKVFQIERDEAPPSGSRQDGRTRTRGRGTMANGIRELRQSTRLP